MVSTFKGLFSIIDFLLDITFGYTITKGWREEREKAENYEHSAQV